MSSPCRPPSQRWFEARQHAYVTLADGRAFLVARPPARRRASYAQTQRRARRLLPVFATGRGTRRPRHERSLAWPYTMKSARAYGKELPFTRRREPGSMSHGKDPTGFLSAGGPRAGSSRR